MQPPPKHTKPTLVQSVFCVHKLSLVHEIATEELRILGCMPA